MATEKHRILLVEDEAHMAFNLQFNLQAEGFDVVPAIDGAIALQKFREDGPFDLIILDCMLPEVNGFDVAEEIRRTDDQTQILMVTALGKAEDCLRGFAAGVDDYITKPFHLEELLARVRRMVRRARYFQQEEGAEAETVKIDGFELDPQALKFKTPYGEYEVTAMEADILKEFLSNPSRVLTREFLLRQVWGIQGNPETRTVDNFVARLRKYIERDPADPKHLISVRGRGYRFVTESLAK